MNSRVITYSRFCSASANMDESSSFLADVCAENGWRVVDILSDRPYGNSKSRIRLPGLAVLLRAVTRREVDIVLVRSLHHLGTSVETLLATLAELHRYGVKLVVHDHADSGDVEASGLTAAAGLLLETRRAYRRERIVAGQLRAKAAGVRFGRPPVPQNRLEKARVALRSGQGVREAARNSGISAGKVSRIRAEMVSVPSAQFASLPNASSRVAAE
jgi:DNA invertase Pin-like site-specific DNA recombinase